MNLREDDPLREPELRIAEVMREAGETLIRLALHVEERGFSAEYVLEAYEKFNERMATVSAMAKMLVTLRRARYKREE